MALSVRPLFGYKAAGGGGIKAQGSPENVLRCADSQQRAGEWSDAPQAPVLLHAREPLAKNRPRDLGASKWGAPHASGART